MTEVVCSVTGDCGTGNTYPPTIHDVVDPNNPGGGGGSAPGDGGLTIGEIIDQLANVIELSHLAESLRSRINLITTLEVGFNQFQNQVVTDNSVMAQELVGIRDDLSAAMAYINNQINIEVSERESLVNSVNQVVASLNSQLSAALQTESTVRAEQTGALFAEYTVKADLAGHVSGFGLSAYADPTEAVSEFRVAADRFSIAPPAFVSPTPPAAADRHDGKVWVDTSGGGAVTKWWDAAFSQWKLTPVAAAQPFVYLSTPTTLPDGTVLPPGLYVRSVFASKITADQIDTKNLTIKDSAGNVIFGAGTKLNMSQILGLGSLASQNSVSSWQVSGLGGLATEDNVFTGYNVRFHDGSLMSTSDFVNRLSKITSGNIGTFMANAAIGQAYIGNAAIGSAQIQDASVGTLKISGGSVTSMSYGSGGGGSYGAGGGATPCTTWVSMVAGSSGVVVLASIAMMSSSSSSQYLTLRRNGSVDIGFSAVSLSSGFRGVFVVLGFDSNPPAGSNSYSLSVNNPTSGPGSNVGCNFYESSIVATGGKR